MTFGVLRTSYPELQYEKIDEESMLLMIPRSYDCVAHLSPEEATLRNPYFIRGEDVGSIPFLVPYLGSGLNRGANFLMERAHIVPSKITSCTNMNTAFQLAASGVGALFLTAESFVTRFPECVEKLAFCTTQLPLYTRHSTACFRPENRNRELIDAVIEITRNNVIPTLRPWLQRDE